MKKILLLLVCFAIYSCATYEEKNITVAYSSERELRYLNMLLKDAKEAGIEVLGLKISVSIVTNPTIDYIRDEDGEVILEVETDQYEYHIEGEVGEKDPFGNSHIRITPNMNGGDILRTVRSYVNRFL
jgi:hypothetical protein